MKKTLLIAMLMVSSSVFAASTGTLTLTGTVVPVNDIVINLIDPSVNITAGVSGKLVATVSETSNNLAGYRIRMKSVNASRLIHASDSTKLTAYTVSYDGRPAVSLTATDQDVKPAEALPGLTTDTSNINVNVTAYPLAPAGVYSDTITISIVAN